MIFRAKIKNKCMPLDYSYFRRCYRDIDRDHADVSFDDPVFEKLNRDYAQLHPVNEFTGRRISDLEVLDSCTDPVTYNLIRGKLMQPVAGSDAPDGMTDAELLNMKQPVGINRSDYVDLAGRVVTAVSRADYAPAVVDPVPPSDPE